MPFRGLDASAEDAQAADAADPLAPLRDAFELPPGVDGRPARYLCGHSLGLMPRAARAAVAAELERWSTRGVGGHFDGDGGWYAFHERFAAPLAKLTGASADEVVAMNSLTVNLHLMLVSFFRPEGDRRRLLIERGAFPSDRFALRSQLALHGLDPERDLLELGTRPGERITADALNAVLESEAGRVALVLLPGVQYLSGEAVDLAACAAVARRHGCRIGFDLAHAIGNLALDLTAADADFAVWCSYKYLNGGPGAIGGCYVNRRWIADAGLPRLAGWWGQDQSLRFDTAAAFTPTASAEAWQLSNPPILAMAPLAASLALFESAGMARLREKSIALTAYLERLLDLACGDAVELLSPREPAARGAQLSLRLKRGPERAAQIVAGLRARGIVIDWRAPDTLRLAPAPLYNCFADVHAAVSVLADLIAD